MAGDNAIGSLYSRTLADGVSGPTSPRPGCIRTTDNPSGIPPPLPPPPRTPPHPCELMAGSVCGGVIQSIKTDASSMGSVTEIEVRLEEAAPLSLREPHLPYALPP